jgi:hypothetical protein
MNRAILALVDDYPPFLAYLSTFLRVRGYDVRAYAVVRLERVKELTVRTVSTPQKGRTARPDADVARAFLTDSAVNVALRRMLRDDERQEAA